MLRTAGLTGALDPEPEPLRADLMGSTIDARAGIAAAAFGYAGGVRLEGKIQRWRKLRWS